MYTPSSRPYPKPNFADPTFFNVFAEGKNLPRLHELPIVTSKLLNYHRKEPPA